MPKKLRDNCCQIWQSNSHQQSSAWWTYSPWLINGHLRVLIFYNWVFFCLSICFKGFFVDLKTKFQKIKWNFCIFSVHFEKLWPNTIHHHLVNYFFIFIHNPSFIRRSITMDYGAKWQTARHPPDRSQVHRTSTSSSFHPQLSMPLTTLESPTYRDGVSELNFWLSRSQN